MERELVDVGVASRITGLARSTLYRLSRHGRIRTFKVLGALRFDRTDLQALIIERPARPVAPAALAGELP